MSKSLEVLCINKILETKVFLLNSLLITTFAQLSESDFLEFKNLIFNMKKFFKELLNFTNRSPYPRLQKLPNDSDVQISKIEDHKEVLYTWGSNSFGQLGNPEANEKSEIPNPILTIPPGYLSSVSCGIEHSAIITNSENGKLN